MLAFKAASWWWRRKPKREEKREQFYTQGGAKVGLLLWVWDTQSLFFSHYCILFHVNNCKPTLSRPIFEAGRKQKLWDIFQKHNSSKWDTGGLNFIFIQSEEGEICILWSLQKWRRIYRCLNQKYLHSFE